MIVSLSATWPSVKFGSPSVRWEQNKHYRRAGRGCQQNKACDVGIDLIRKQIGTIPNQSSVAKAYQEFDDVGRMKASPYYERVVDVMEELVKFTLLTRDSADYLVDRYSERKAKGRLPHGAEHAAAL